MNVSQLKTRSENFDDDDDDDDDDDNNNNNNNNNNIFNCKWAVTRLAVVIMHVHKYEIKIT